MILEKRAGREKPEVRENISWLPSMQPPTGIKPETQVRNLTGN